MSDAAGIINFSGLLSQSSVILSAACQQIVLLHLLHDRREAWRKSVPRICALAIILIGMVILFSAATATQEKPDDFALSKAQYYPLYLSIYLLGFTMNQIDVGLLGWKCAKVAPTPWLYRGLILIALTLPFSVIYVGCRVAAIIVGNFGMSGHDWEIVAQLSVSAAAIIQMVGWTVPDWGRHVSAAWSWLNDWRSFREVRSLHQELTRHAPQVVLNLDTATELRTRLYRIVVEIRDAQWALRTWVPQGTAEAACAWAKARGLNGVELAAVVEATQLRAALRCKAQGQPPVRHEETPLAAEPQSLADEIGFQRHLVRAFNQVSGPDFPHSESTQNR
ncbi:hypothetical protein FF041_34825 [Streptomyces jumonjinensis]|uniref:DUF6545 domain-containing protein n=1 Tax=Streptomyces jumonjinensis TaxID=1945 RepID=A0A646KS20_STRJU|nr:hypothetical protein [Streptomyces jumonjinensis]